MLYVNFRQAAASHVHSHVEHNKYILPRRTVLAYAHWNVARERERVFTPFQPHRADAGAARTSPGRYHNRVFNHCVKQQKSLPKSILTKAVGNEEHLQNMRISLSLSKKPRMTHLPWRQTKEASVITSSNICELCRATTQCKSTNQTMPGGYYNNTSEQAQRFSKCRQRVPQAH